MLDSSTFKMAIALAASAVPGNSRTAGAAPRSSKPAVSTPRATSRIGSSPKRRCSQAAKAETTPKQITGVAASTDSAADDRCSRVPRSGKIGGRLVIAVRRLNPAAATATTSSVIWYFRRGPPGERSAISNQSYRKHEITYLAERTVLRAPGQVTAVQRGRGSSADVAVQRGRGRAARTRGLEARQKQQLAGGPPGLVPPR